MFYVDLEIELCERVRAEIAEYSSANPRPPRAIFLNPGNYELLGWEEMLGLPVLPDPRVEPDKAMLLCGEEGWGGEFEGQPVFWHEGSPHHFVADDVDGDDSLVEEAAG